MHVLVALGHTLGNFGPGRQVPTPEESQVYDAMAQLTMRFPGPRHTLMDFATGWSVSMGLLYLGFGAVNLTLEHALRKEGRGVPAPVSFVNALVSLGGLIVAALYFSPPPLPFLAAAVICFGVASARSRKAAP
ncbi:hypothetical protein NR798_13170 [Archangium gephyra]|uniref:LIC_13387 family protein n=1 Tax=Archangium gephyra TaxID=48 RepID=UPI0035D441AE